MPCIVRIPNGGSPYWLADHTPGDPARTLLAENAQRFPTREKASKALAKAQLDWPERTSLFSGQVIHVQP